MSTTRLGLENSGGSQRIVKARRAIEPDDAFEMANLYPRDTGLPMTLWVSPRGRARLDARNQGLHDTWRQDGRRQYRGRRNPTGTPAADRRFAGARFRSGCEMDRRQQGGVDRLPGGHPEHGGVRDPDASTVWDGSKLGLLPFVAIGIRLPVWRTAPDLPQKNVPSGMMPSNIRPAASKCASRDWICCDRVCMSRNRRSNGVPGKIESVPAAL